MRISLIEYSEPINNLRDVKNEHKDSYLSLSITKITRKCNYNDTKQWRFRFGGGQSMCQDSKDL